MRSDELMCSSLITIRKGQEALEELSLFFVTRNIGEEVVIHDGLRVGAEYVKDQRRENTGPILSSVAMEVNRLGIRGMLKGTVKR